MSVPLQFPLSFSTLLNYFHRPARLRPLFVVSPAVLWSGRENKMAPFGGVVIQTDAKLVNFFKI
jgi:hypothetical protein